MQAYPTFTLLTTPVTEIVKVNFKPNSELLKIGLKFGLNLKFKIWFKLYFYNFSYW